ncbi:MAG: magnesium chelatase subunit H [Betaproteobacteria bacterium]|nr:magnesium chelatase subunit H [Betaproteobacteria bacterium]NBT10060.1 magnesium chelatase subunit H [Betaproteobacteria bacterium]NBU50202.1 magnesium chelatase subunit H [Betaproteobacteria bacterium]
MTPRPISVVDARGSAAMKVTIVTMDSHLCAAAERAHRALSQQLPGVQLTVHAASEWNDSPAKLQVCLDDIAGADIVIAAMLFLEDHYNPVLPALRARRDQCDALVCILSATEVTKLTRLGKFDMQAPQTGAMAFLKNLRGKHKDGEAGGQKATAGERQMKMLRRLPKILRYIPGTAQDVRAYFLCLQYWLSGSDTNIGGMVHFLVDRYAGGPRAHLRGLAKPAEPMEYPDVGLYHPRMQQPGTVGRMSTSLDALPSTATTGRRGTVGLLLMRSYLLAGNTAHYDGVITALEARGLRVIPAFASGLDARPAIEAFHMQDGRSTIDALLSLTGFSLVGGPAYNDTKAAEAILARLDVPYFASYPVEFQTLHQWGASDRGLLPVEATMMVAIPELDGSSGAMVFGGRGSSGKVACTGCSHRCTFENTPDSHDMHSCIERADMLAARMGRIVDLRRARRADKRVGLVIFNFPPNAGNTGTAAYLSVFESLHNTMTMLKQQGYTLEVPATVDELRRQIIEGNAATHGAMANVHALIGADEHVRREPHLAEIEAQWGPAPGRQQSDGRHIWILGKQFGNVFVGIQPAFGYEGDPMRLLFEKGFAPTHAFSAFYRWLKEDFNAHAVLHFGTHGALEFMPGKQTGMTGNCWPDRLIGDLPNLYLYASNNPSEGTIAKRRAAATLISYLTPPVAQADLYKGLADLKALVERYRGLEPEALASEEGADILNLIRQQTLDLQLVESEEAWRALNGDAVGWLNEKLLELEYTLIPHGLHVVGQPPSTTERVDMLMALAESSHEAHPPRAWVQTLVEGTPAQEVLRRLGEPPDAQAQDLLQHLADADRLLAQDFELQGIFKGLEGRFIRPAPGGDLMRSPDILPTGRNLHGFDPFRIPSAYAVRDGARQAQRLLARHMSDGNAMPESVALVLWGTDNLKSEGGPIAQALALMGTKPRFDSYGRLAGAELIDLQTLGRPRIDVVITISGIFRDLLPLQIKLLAEAAYLAAAADEPLEMNPVRRHALAYQQQHRCDLETASLRVFGNADGAYGSNVGSLVDNAKWDHGDELAETYSRRKGFAYGRSGKPMQQGELLKSVLADVSLAYQNLESVELGVTTIDTYFDTLGGVSKAIQRAKGGDAPVAPVYIGDQTRDTHGGGTVRTLTEQVALETRTRMLNPKWYEGMLKHGYEGVRQIEVHVTNTLGWSATTGQVQPWVYQQLSETFMLDPEMRDRLARLNPTASARVANRLLEAYERNYWQPDEATLNALRRAGEELEDRLEGVFEGAGT